MSFESDFKDFMPHAVQIEPQTGLDGDGEYAFGTAVSYSGLIVNRIRTIRTDTGDERVSNTTIWVNTTSAITGTARITLPTGFDPQRPPILRVDRQSDDDGLHHTVIYC